MTRYDADDIHTKSVDAALSTTRAVRRRLDLERPVDPQIILDCIDVAEQAPTGGNQSSRRWIVIRDQATKQALADLYMETAGRWMVEARDRLEGSGHHNEKVMSSSAYLAEHLAEVPVLVVPTIMGRHDNSGKPGLFDSVIQSAWSFAVALRARGLGTTWVTAVFSEEDKVAKILGVPADVTQIAMLPVAWTKGTSFATAPRPAATEITFIDHFGRTFERAPADPPTLADGPGARVEIDIKAKPPAVWKYVSDIGVSSSFSDEATGADWDPPHTEAALGATFTGTNTHGAIGDWSVPCLVDVYEHERLFGWCTSDPENPGARWRFELVPVAGGTRLVYTVHLGPGPSGITAAINSMPDKEAKILARRVDEHRVNMGRVLRGIKALAEETVV